MALTLHGTVADNTAVLSRPNAKPLIINGSMAVAQRGTSTTGITGTADGVFSVDRMKINLADNGTWTQTQDTDVPAGQGFANSWKLDCTTADTSVAAGSYNVARYHFEGQDLQLLKKGTANAEKVTVSFWIKATVTGTYIVELYDIDNDRQISQAYTVNDSNTWEKKVLSFVADTAGALGDDNGSSFSINLWLGAGSNFSSGTLSTTWTSYTHANRAVGQVNSASSTSNNVYFTGLQMEVGDFDANSIAPFQHESYGDSLIRCFRYFERNHHFGVIQVIGYTTNGIAFAVQKRASPTLTFYSGTNGAGTAGSLTESEASGAAKVVASSVVNISGIARLLITSSGQTNTTMRGSFDAAAEL